MTSQKTSWIYESPDGGKTIYRYICGNNPRKKELIEKQNKFLKL